MPTTIQVTGLTNSQIIESITFHSVGADSIVFGDWSAVLYDRSGAYLFASVAIPQGAIIDTADLSLVAISKPGSPGPMPIAADDVDNSTQTTSYADFLGRTQTAAVADWTPAAWTNQVRYNDNEIKTVIQEIVDRPGWVSGNDILIFVNNSTPTGYVADAAYVAFAYEIGPGTFPPYLNVTFSVPIIQQIGIATETNTALTIVPIKPIIQSVGIATETDTVLAITAYKPIIQVIGLVLETNTAFAINPLKPIIQPIGIATEVDTVFAITPIKPIIFSLGIAIEINTALPIFVLVPIADISDPRRAFSDDVVGRIYIDSKRSFRKPGGRVYR